MKRIFGILAALVIIASMFAAPAYAQDGVTPLEPQTPPPSADTGVMVDETPSIWFVELSSAPTADGTSLATVKAEKAAFRKAAKAAGLKYTERYAFDTLWNGLSVKIEAGQLAKLARIPGVKNIYPVGTIPMPIDEAGNPDLFTSLNMIGAVTAQSELGYTGTGIKVAVMDTGIDYDHQAFGGDGVIRLNSTHFPTARVAYGYDLVGDAYNADSTSPLYNPVPTPDKYPDDCYGHGSHVAGIIGANDPEHHLKGVAPDVTFGSYRVFGCEGSTTDDIMIAAMERALADGMQVLNMSIGSAFTWPQYPTAVASNRLVNKGMVVVASIGNSGANGLYSAGAPGLGEKVIGVASFDNTNVVLPYFTVNGRNMGYIAMTFSAPVPTSGTGEIVNIGLACSALPAGSLTGKVAHAQRGTCSFGIKATNAIAAGAVAVLISNNAPGVFSGTLGAPLPNPKPVVGISQADGSFLLAQAAPIMMTWTDQVGSFPNPTGGLISSFSSYGLSPDLALKPDIGAPGGNIYSTYPLEKGGYTVMSGTSMASPHVAGSAALLLEAKPNTPAQAVRGILQNSAVPKPWWGAPTAPYLDNVHRQGAGMVQIDKAILATTKIEPSKISAGESQAGPKTVQLAVENNAAAPVTYSLGYAVALSTGSNTFAPTFYLSDATVTFAAPSVTVPAGGNAIVTATINPATGPDGGLYGGYIVFTPEGGGQTYRVPFAGYIGDYQARQVLTSGGYGFPALGWTPNGINFGFAGEGDTFTMAGFDIPYLLVHFDHQARLFRVDIYAKSGKDWHRAFNEEYMIRSSTSTGFFAFPFDGTTYAGTKMYTVPDGTYYAVISVLKANGDASNPAHWETWTSPNFVIDRP